MTYFIFTASKRHPEIHEWAISCDRANLAYIVKELELDFIANASLFSPDDYMMLHGLSRMSTQDWADYNYTIDMWRTDYVFSYIYEVEDDKVNLSTNSEVLVEKWGKRINVI